MLMCLAIGIISTEDSHAEILFTLQKAACRSPFGQEGEEKVACKRVTVEAFGFGADRRALDEDLRPWAKERTKRLCECPDVRKQLYDALERLSVGDADGAESSVKIPIEHLQLQVA